MIPLSSAQLNKISPSDSHLISWISFVAEGKGHFVELELAAKGIFEISRHRLDSSPLSGVEVDLFHHENPLPFLHPSSLSILSLPLFSSLLFSPRPPTASYAAGSSRSVGSKTVLRLALAAVFIGDRHSDCKVPNFSCREESYPVLDDGAVCLGGAACLARAYRRVHPST
jgi:hypothetical protein